MYALTLLGATGTGHGLHTPSSYAPRLSPEAEVPHHDHSTSSWLREERASPQASTRRHPSTSPLARQFARSASTVAPCLPRGQLSARIAVGRE